MSFQKVDPDDPIIDQLEQGLIKPKQYFNYDAFFKEYNCAVTGSYFQLNSDPRKFSFTFRKAAQLRGLMYGDDYDFGSQETGELSERKTFIRKISEKQAVVIRKGRRPKLV